MIQKSKLKYLLMKLIFFRIKEKIKELAKFVKKTQQTDDYFMPVHRNFVEPKFPFEWLSIRKRGDKIILNYKHWHPENVEIATHCDEFETEIKNPDKLEKMFLAIDIKRLVTVEKEREVYIYEDKFEISLD